MNSAAVDAHARIVVVEARAADVGRSPMRRRRRRRRVDARPDTRPDDKTKNESTARGRTKGDGADARRRGGAASPTTPTGMATTARPSDGGTVGASPVATRRSNAAAVVVPRRAARRRLRRASGFISPVRAVVWWPGRCCRLRWMDFTDQERLRGGGRILGGKRTNIILRELGG